MSFNSNNDEYSIVTDTEISNIISYFSNDMIMDVVNNNISIKYRDYSMNLGNIVGSYEMNFKQYMVTYPDYINEFNQTRQEVYNEIINILCTKHNLTFIADRDIVDLYSAAYYLYGILVSEFSANIVTFFVNYIIKEKTSLAQLVKVNKMKDTTTIYSTKLYQDDPKLAIVHADLDNIINDIFTFDIDFEMFISYLFYNNKIVGNFLMSIVSDNGDFFKNYIVPYVIAYKPIILTNIKLQLQNLVKTDNNIIELGNAIEQEKNKNADNEDY